MERNALQARYRAMTEEEKMRNYLAVDLDLVIGGKAELLLELISLLEGREEEMSLILKRVIRELLEALEV